VKQLPCFAKHASCGPHGDHVGQKHEEITAKLTHRANKKHSFGNLFRYDAHRRRRLCAGVQLVVVSVAYKLSWTPNLILLQVDFVVIGGVIRRRARPAAPFGRTR
jgi:hypothetical protein